MYDIETRFYDETGMLDVKATCDAGRRARARVAVGRVQTVKQTTRRMLRTAGWLRFICI